MGIDLWCNGNTPVFGTGIQGSSPCGSTTVVSPEITYSETNLFLGWFFLCTTDINYDKNMKLLFWLVKNKRNKQGRIPIYCRITINGERAELSTEIFIHEKDFDKRYKKVRAAEPNSETNNKIITTLSHTLQNIYYNQIFYESNTPSAHEMKLLYIERDKKRTTLIIPLLYEYADERYSANNKLELYQRDKRQAKLIEKALKNPIAF